MVFRDPSGAVIPETGERPRLDRRSLGWPVIKMQNESLGLHAEMGACKWNGRPVSYQLAVRALVRMQE